VRRRKGDEQRDEVDERQTGPDRGSPDETAPATSKRRTDGCSQYRMTVNAAANSEPTSRASGMNNRLGRVANGHVRYSAKATSAPSRVVPCADPHGALRLALFDRRLRYSREPQGQSSNQKRADGNRDGNRSQPLHRPGKHRRPHACIL